MTLTINSGVASYCSPLQFCTLYDWRSYGQLASDTDVPLPSSAALQASAILITKLQVTAGMIEMAVTRGARYDNKDLTALVTATPPLSNSAWQLIQLNADLAAAEMYGRRFEGLPKEVKEKYDIAFEMLAALEAGEAVFGFLETQQAGLVQDYRELAVDVEKRNLPSYIAHRVFGRRANRIDVTSP